MSSCSAYGCTNRGNKDNKLSFHRIPSLKRAEIRTKWLQNIRREGELPKNMFICSEHFEKSCFERDLKVKLHLQIF